MKMRVTIIVINKKMFVVIYKIKKTPNTACKVFMIHTYMKKKYISLQNNVLRGVRVHCAPLRVQDIIKS